MLENYETVAERLARWLPEAVNPRVITHMVSEPGADICVFKAELWADRQTESDHAGHTWSSMLIATGWAEEIRNQGNVNRTSHVENCETSAIGRALANAGMAGSDPTRRASREEMSKVVRVENHVNTVVRATTSDAPPAFDRSRPLTGAISEKQVGYIKGACKREGHPSPVGLDRWSKQDASAWIDAHKNGTNAGDCPKPSEEEPF